MELDADAVSLPSLFDLEGRTLRFTPEGYGYRAENLPLQWMDDVGDEVEVPQLPVGSFAFPMAGASWDSMFVNPLGTISFGAGARAFQIGRFDELRTAGASVVNTAPVISAFMKPRMKGSRFINRLPDRVVVTWDLNEPVGGIFDFTFEPTVNRFQAVLHEDGSIDLSYRDMSAEDGIVGIFTPSRGGPGEPIAEASDPEDPKVQDYYDIRALRLSRVDGLLAVTIETRGDLPDMMFLEGLERVGEDEDGNRVYPGDPLTVTIEDVIAADGPRLPPFEDSQKEFKTGMVAIVLHGERPSRMLLENLQGIRDEWVRFWSNTTGGVSTMRTDIVPPSERGPGG